MFLDLVSRSPRETQHLGSYLGELAQAGDIFLLRGGLGTGKTCLVQGMAQGLGSAEPARSPSFVLVHCYEGRLPLYHIDLYRLECVEEVVELGLEDYFYGKGVCVVEWAERALSIFPPEHMLISLAYLSPRRRSLRMEPKGKRYEEMLEQVRYQIAAGRG
ncbi:MAG: tRNA (adenosine(37)-N6)-threonylcarbamoyltransferase complex ATPase subunit type 1 TsaE [Chloroflexi bacterium]|nr:tRNA (adenosine(37)-N6)-threonylcarbamoyltransferase complex ATPase subunit type 1 TsaE [Chloroflexota bacterium]